MELEEEDTDCCIAMPKQVFFFCHSSGILTEEGTRNLHKCFPTMNTHNLQLHCTEAFRGSILIIIIILKGLLFPCSQFLNSTLDKYSGIRNAQGANVKVTYLKLSCLVPLCTAFIHRSESMGEERKDATIKTDLNIIH